MRYLIALIWPPLAAVTSAPTGQAVINALLWFGGLICLGLFFPLAFLLWLASLFHALALVRVFYEQRRAQEIAQITEATKAGVIAALQGSRPQAPAQPANYDSGRDVYKL